MRTWPALRVCGLAAGSPDAVSWPDLVQAALCDHPVAAIEETSADEWRVFFQAAAERDAAAAALASAYPTLTVQTLDVDDEDWAARSQANLRAIEAGRIIVAPPWDRRAGSDRIEIVIEPSMGFGTGHHATTRLCLQALQHIPLTGARVLDVGTGSGVLAIAAVRLGAASAVGIDDDPDAVQAARDNVALNAAHAVTLDTIDLRTYTVDAYDVLTANLTGGLLVATAAHLQRLTRPGGHLILSGFMTHEVEAVFAAFDQCGRVDHSSEDEWHCATLVRRP